MSEVLEFFPRGYVEFVDPQDSEQIFRCDLTWLTSRWSCIFGRGCQGIFAEVPHAGCCALGAHFCDHDDEVRVASHVTHLTDELWEHRQRGLAQGWVENEPADTMPSGSEPARKTTLVAGACIFLNTPGFPGGAGCALHALALATGIPITHTKPDVCWQLPLRRQYRTVTRQDDTTYTEVSIGEYVREGWGAGGHDLDWYCTSHPKAHCAAEPVYRSCRTELIEMMGTAAYAQLVQCCEVFEAGFGPVHPATVRTGNSPPVSSLEL